MLTWHWEHCIPLHPINVQVSNDGTTGGYLRRLSSRRCIFSTDSDLLAIRQHDAEAFHTVSALEQKIGFTMCSTGSLVQIVDATNSSIEAQSAQTCLPF